MLCIEKIVHSSWYYFLFGGGGVLIVVFTIIPIIRKKKDKGHGTIDTGDNNSKINVHVEITNEITHNRINSSTEIGGSVNGLNQYCGATDDCRSRDLAQFGSNKYYVALYTELMIKKKDGDKIDYK